MVNLSTAGAGIAGTVGLWKLAGPIFNGNNNQDQGPYDSRLKRAAYATVAAVTGTALSYTASAAFSNLDENCPAKTILATTTLIVTAPSIVSRIWNGDQGHKKRLGMVEGGPYSSFISRALGHISEGAAATSLVYMTTEFPEASAAIASTSGSIIYKAAETGLTLGWETTKTALKLTENALYYGVETATTLTSLAGSLINGLATGVEIASNATHAARNFTSSFFRS